MVTGIILAGGCSSRAKTNKLLLLVDRKPLILHTISSIRPHVDHLIVVTGRYDEELRPYLSDVEVVFNSKYESGMFSSVLAGLSHAQSDVLILPADMASISHSTFTKLIENKGVISIPTYQEKSGHPLFLSKAMVDELLNEDINSNLEKFIKSHINLVNYVEVDDPFIKFDIDTIEDYNHFLAKRKELSYES